MSDAGARRRVLVAEDNPVSRMLLESQLAALGFEVDTAENGREALEASARTGYAMIFMDCHMPEMDGLEAARRIREREGDGPKTPIVAVTATGAQLTEVHAAGIDEGLAKPVSSDDLAAVLSRYLEGWRTKAASSAAQELGNLRRIGERWGSGALVRMTRLCLRQIPERLETLRLAVAEGDAKRIEEDSHFVKGTAHTIGAESLAEHFAELEKCGKTGDLEDVGRRLRAVTEEYERVERELRALLAEHEGPSGEK